MRRSRRSRPKARPWRRASRVRGREALTVGGLAAGIVGAIGLTRLMSGVMFGITPLDVTSHAAAAAVLIAVASGTCLLPAVRAASTDPAVALRGE